MLPTFASECQKWSTNFGNFIKIFSCSVKYSDSIDCVKKVLSKCVQPGNVILRAIDELKSFYGEECGRGGDITNNEV